MLIDQSITDQKKARVYFTLLTRAPLFGKFVCLGDAKELEQKGMVRFVTEYKVEDFDQSPNVWYTRIFAIDSFADIKLF